MTPVGAVADNGAAAQREAEARPQGGGFFSKKYGPLPGWGWAALAGVGAIAWFWWRSRSNSQASSPADTSGTDTGSTDPQVQDQLASLQDEIDALQGELSSTGGGSAGGGGGGSGGGDGGGGSGGGSGHKWVTATGKEDLYQIARSAGISESKLLKLNSGQKNLQKYVGTGKDLPKGWKVRVS